MNKLPIVISASRMTDMPAFYPEALITEMENRLKKGVQIHTLVIWTKHPQSLFKSPLYPYLLRLKSLGIQLFLQLTITGMANEVVGRDINGKPIIVEPGVPNTTDTLNTIPQLIELLGLPDRIRLRIDPIVRLREHMGNAYSNISTFEFLIKACSKSGINNFTFSFLEKGMHTKVDKRFVDKGLEIVSPTKDERDKTGIWMKQLEIKYAVRISSCCVPGMQPSKCIDGELLMKLHEFHLPLSTKEPHSRPLCGCTESVDIGGWPPKACASGCLYCYARPIRIRN